MRYSIFEKIYLWIIKIGLWLVPFLPLYVSPSLLFPFITGKNFTFRIAIQILFALWVGLAIAKKEYRPKLTPLFKAVSVFVAIVFLADLLSPNPYRSFFSNYERMEGFMMIFHLYLYFLMLITVFKKRDWLVFFNSTILASLIVSYIGLRQKLGLAISIQGGFRVDSTIGNPTYLAAYLLFHIWLSLLLMYEFRGKLWPKFLYGAIALFELAILYFTATRGAVLALAGTAILFAGALVWFWPKVFPAKAGLRKIAAAVLVLAVVIPLGFWIMRKTDFVQSRPALRRLTNYSLEETTIKSRFEIWKMSARAALERPILGWGQENYYLVFQKYYNPELYAQEPWFDRSHNIIFDWLVHTGIAGLLSYLSVLVLAFWSLIRAMRRALVPFWRGLVIMAMFASYFLQNLFVFDNLNTYLLFFAFLGYIQFLTASGSEQNVKPVSTNQKPNDSVLAVSGVIMFLIVMLVGYTLDLKPIYESKDLIAALQIYQVQGTMDDTMASFKEALSYHTFGDTEVREQIANVARSVIDNSRFSAAERKRFIDFTIAEIKKQINISAPDVKHVLFLGSILDNAIPLDPAYASESQKYLEQAAAMSPKKQVIWFELAQFYISTGQTDKAIAALETAWNLERHYRDAGVNLWLFGILTSNASLVDEVKPYFTLQDLDETSLYRLGLAYQRMENYKDALWIYDWLVQYVPGNAKYHAARAALLAYFGRKDEARLETQTAVKLDPSFGPEAEQFLKTLK